jgi:hypothetical protein
MTVSFIHQVVGARFDKFELYKFAYDNISSFRQDIESTLISKGIELYEYMMRMDQMEMNEKNGIDEFVDDNDDDEIRQLIWDNLYSLSDMKYLNVQFFKLTHDLDSDEDFIVGVEIHKQDVYGMSNEDEFMNLSTDDLLVRVKDAKHKVVGDLLVMGYYDKTTRVYIIQDECKCCS